MEVGGLNEMPFSDSEHRSGRLLLILPCANVFDQGIRENNVKFGIGKIFQVPCITDHGTKIRAPGFIAVQIDESHVNVLGIGEFHGFPEMFRPAEIDQPDGSREIGNKIEKNLEALSAHLTCERMRVVIIAKASEKIDHRTFPQGLLMNFPFTGSARILQ
jgi:hypothetical protein